MINAVVYYFKSSKVHTTLALQLLGPYVRKDIDIMMMMTGKMAS